MVRVKAPDEEKQNIIPKRILGELKLKVENNKIFESDDVVEPKKKSKSEIESSGSIKSDSSMSFKPIVVFPPVRSKSFVTADGKLKLK